MADWKSKLPPTIRDYLNDLLREVLEYRKAYKSSKNSRISQLWVAIAILFKELEDLRMEISDIKEKLENLDLKESEETKKLLKTLEQF